MTWLSPTGATYQMPSENLEYDLSEAKMSSQESPLQKPGKVMSIILRKKLQIFRVRKSNKITFMF